MKRPSNPERLAAVNTMAEEVHPDYDGAPDAYGLLNLIPTALGVEADPIRIMLSQSRLRPKESYIMGRKRKPKTQVGDMENAVSEEHVSGGYEERIPGEPESTGKWRERAMAHLRPNQHFSGVVDSLARMLIAVLAAIFLIAPMVALSYIEEKKIRLITATAFILCFCVVASLGSSAGNHEVVMMTAAYAAVIVVFVGQTS